MKYQYFALLFHFYFQLVAKHLLSIQSDWWVETQSMKVDWRSCIKACGVPCARTYGLVETQSSYAENWDLDHHLDGALVRDR